MTKVAVGGAALTGGWRVGVMGLASILFRLSEAGAAFTGDVIGGVGISDLSKHQAKVDFGGQGGDGRQLPVSGAAGAAWYLAAHGTKRKTEKGKKV